MYSFFQNNQALSKKPNEDSFKITNKDSLYDLNGVCNLSLLANKELSIGKIKKMLVYDLMRSLYARVRLLIEDLDAPKEIIGDVPLDDDPNCKTDLWNEGIFFSCCVTKVSRLFQQRTPLLRRNRTRRPTEYTST